MMHYLLTHKQVGIAYYSKLIVPLWKKKKKLNFNAYNVLFCYKFPTSIIGFSLVSAASCKGIRALNRMQTKIERGTIPTKINHMHQDPFFKY